MCVRCGLPGRIWPIATLTGLSGLCKASPEALVCLSVSTTPLWVPPNVLDYNSRACGGHQDVAGSEYVQIVIDLNVEAIQCIHVAWNKRSPLRKTFADRLGNQRAAPNMDHSLFELKNGPAVGNRGRLLWIQGSLAWVIEFSWTCYGTPSGCALLLQQIHIPLRVHWLGSKLTFGDIPTQPGSVLVSACFQTSEEKPSCLKWGNANSSTWGWGHCTNIFGDMVDLGRGITLIHRRCASFQAWESATSKVCCFLSFHFLLFFTSQNGWGKTYMTFACWNYFPISSPEDTRQGEAWNSF